MNTIGKLRLIEILQSFRVESHQECEDGFYSCPAHPGYFGNDDSGECDCGMEENNLLVDEAMGIVSTPSLTTGDILHIIDQEIEWCVKNKHPVDSTEDSVRKTAFIHGLLQAKLLIMQAEAELGEK